MTTLLAVLGTLAALSSAGFTLGRLAQGLGTPFVQLAAFTPWGLVGWPVAAVLFLPGRVWWGLVLSLAFTVVHAVWFARPILRASGAASVAAPGSPAVRVMTLNCLLGQANAAQIVDLVSTEHVDVLLLEELTAGLVVRLHAVGIDAVLPHHDLHPRPGGMGTGIWSRHPLQALGLLAADTPAMPQVIIDVPGAGPVSVTAIHTHPPLWRVVGRWRRQMAMLAGVVARHAPVRHSGVPHSGVSHSGLSHGGHGSASATLPQIVAGDFNATRDHREFRTLLAAGGLVDTAEVARPSDGLLTLLRPGTTWPADRPYPTLTRLDHILVSSESIAVETAAVVAVEGSDHRGLITSLRFR